MVSAELCRAGYRQHADARLYSQELKLMHMDTNTRSLSLESLIKSGWQTATTTGPPIRSDAEASEIPQEENLKRRWQGAVKRPASETKGAPAVNAAAVNAAPLPARRPKRQVCLRHRRIFQGKKKKK